MPELISVGDPRNGAMSETRLGNAMPHGDAREMENGWRFTVSRCDFRAPPPEYWRFGLGDARSLEIAIARSWCTKFCGKHHVFLFQILLLGAPHFMKFFFWKDGRIALVLVKFSPTCPCYFSLFCWQHE